VRALARKRGGKRGAAAMGQHPFKGVTTEVGDGPVEAPRGGQGTLGGGQRQHAATAGCRKADRSPTVMAMGSDTCACGWRQNRGVADAWARPPC
jgi:hypothetical protein